MKLRKNYILPVVLAASLLVCLLAGGMYFANYLKGKIYLERTSQLVELTSQVRRNLDSALNSNWHYLTVAVNILEEMEIPSEEELPEVIGELDRLLEMEENSSLILLLDSQGNCYDADGKHGVWEDLALISAGEERNTFITDSYTQQRGDWAFAQKLERPLETRDGKVVFTHAVLLRDVHTPVEYYDSGAYGSQSETYILKTNGTRMHDGAQSSNKTIQAYNVLKVLQEMEGQGVPDIRAALNETETLSSNFFYEGKEYYYCITSLEKYGALLLFLIPAQYVAPSTVSMVGTIVRTLLILAVFLLFLLILTVATILRVRSGIELIRQEQENRRQQEALNQQLEEYNAMLVESKEAAEQAFQIAEDANRAKSSFLSNMSHDIRTPMNAIVGFAALMSRDAVNPQKVREYTKKITASGQHLLGLINDILDISKIEAGKTSLNLSEENIVDLIENIDAIIRPQMKARKHTFEVYSKDIRHEHVVLDKLRMNQILLNLLSNAVKYTPDGGLVTLTVQELPQQNKQLAHYRFVVEDNGYGMSEEYVKKIFDAFTREEDSITNKIQGTGLGMAITKNLLDLMGGQITVESEKGKGSTFTMELNLQISEHGIDQDFWKNHGITRILAVDDEEVVCQNIQMAMEETGVAVDYALDGETAVDMVKRAQQGGSLYNVVLIDWKMPVMDGIETVKRIRQDVSGEIPILILTSYDWPEIEESSNTDDIDAFLPKPFFLTSFRQKVDELLNRAAASGTEEDGEHGVLQGMHILVAEDNEINAEILSELLDIEGASCEICENGEIAVKTFDASDPGQYQLILMDVQMPVMNGYDATRVIRSLAHPMAKRIPIVAMTANAFAEDIKDALESGMNAHVAKPVDMAVLEQAVKSVLSKENAEPAD